MSDDVRLLLLLFNKGVWEVETFLKRSGRAVNLSKPATPLPWLQALGYPLPTWGVGVAGGFRRS